MKMFCTRINICLFVALIININQDTVLGDVFTSIEKIKEVLFHEKRLLSGIKQALKDVNPTTETESVLKFCQERQEKLKTESNKNIRLNIKHPNGVYLMIKLFANTYENVRQDIKKIDIPYMQAVLQDIPSQLDVEGAERSIIRLQNVYRLKPGDMAKGRYLGHQGPSLSAKDTFNIGYCAFQDKQYLLSVPWFKVTRSKMLNKRSDDDPSMEFVIGWLSTAQMKDYENDESKDPEYGLNKRKVLKLWAFLRALRTTNTNKARSIIDFEMKKVNVLCAEMDKKYPRMSDPTVSNCFYRSMMLPYYRIGEEILSLDPYISIVYNITNQKESTDIKKQTARKLFRAEVYDAKGSNRSDYRTSHVAFMGESESSSLTSVTKRLAYLTGLRCDTNPRGYDKEQSAGERYQIVNYGIGGHYSVHLDTYEPSFQESLPILKHSGNRIATALIYLSPVESGGSTVFPWMDIAVPPLQHSALLWYSVDTTGNIDFRTRHAGCPLIVGDKWVMNKWILSHANTFTRPCDLIKKTNKQQLETVIKV